MAKNCFIRRSKSAGYLEEKPGVCQQGVSSYPFCTVSFLHLWTRSGREKVYWDTACDIVAEGIIDSLHDPAFKRPVSWTRQKTEQLRKSQRLVSPAAIYSWLLELPEDEFTALRREYYTDDHRYWPDEQQMAANPSAGEDGKRESSRVQSELETHGSEQGDQAEAIAAQIKAGKSRRSYREFSAAVLCIAGGNQNRPRQL